MKSTRVMRLVVGLWIAASGMLPAAISIDGFTSLTNDRFANDGSFIMAGFDLSGVGITDNNRWVTMVSENVFLSANHFFPSNGTSVTFYGTNDPSGTSATRTVLSSQRIGSSDLRIGVLSEPLSAGFSFYDYATEDATTLAEFDLTPYVLENAYLFGRSPTSFTRSQDMAVGRNVIDYWLDSVSAGGTTDDAFITTVNDAGHPNHVEYEAALSSGDSGAPVFIDNGMGGLTMVGLNWFITQTTVDEVTSTTGAGHSYLGNYDEEITAFIAANAVPEPVMLGLVFGISAMACAGGRRRR